VDKVRNLLCWSHDPYQSESLLLHPLSMRVLLRDCSHVYARKNLLRVIRRRQDLNRKSSNPRMDRATWSFVFDYPISLIRQLTLRLHRYG